MDFTSNIRTLISTKPAEEQGRSAVTALCEVPTLARSPLSLKKKAAFKSSGTFILRYATMMLGFECAQVRPNELMAGMSSGMILVWSAIREGYRFKQSLVSHRKERRTFELCTS